MPLTAEELNNAKYVSLLDLSNRLDNIESIEDKVAFATRYLLSHGMGSTDCTFKEAIHFARMKIAEFSLKEKDRLYDDDNLDLDPVDYPLSGRPEIVNPFVENERDDLENEMFMGNPVDYLKGKAQDLIDEIEEEDIEPPEQIALKENCARLVEELNHTTKKDMSTVDTHSDTIDIRVRLQAKFGNRNITNEIKPGVFSRMFNTYSLAYSNLDQVYKAFNNPNHALYGDINALEKAANEYLMHKFPDWTPDQPLPTAEQIARLSGTDKARSEFSVAIIDAVKDQRKVYDHFCSSAGSNKTQNIKYSDLQNANNVNQANFQNQLNEDLANDDSLSEEDNLDSSKTSMKIKGKDMDDNLEKDEDELSIDDDN